MKASVFTLVAISSLLAASLPTAAAIINVPDDWPTIQAGIDAAASGDTVLVHPGTYTGPGNRDVDFGMLNLSLVSIAGRDSTIINCEGSSGDPHRGFLLTGGQDTTCVIQGLTVTHAWADVGSGIFCADSSPAVRDVAFIENGSMQGVAYCTNSSARLTDVDFTGTDSPAYDSMGMYCDSSSPILIRVTFSGHIGGGLHCANGSDAVIRDCLFVDNFAAFQFGGLRCSDSSPTLERVRFVDNHSLFVGGMLCENASPSLTDVTFVGNNVSAGAGAGGLMCSGPTSPELLRVEFIDNNGNSTGGMRCTGGASPNLTEVLFLGNYSNNGDGGMTCIDSSPLLMDVAFTANACSMDAGGMSISGVSAPVLQDIVFSGNYALPGSGPHALGCGGGATPLIRNATFRGNGHPEYGYDLAPTISSYDSAPLFENCIIAFTHNAEAVGWCSGPLLPTFNHCCSFGNALGDSLCGAHVANLFENPLFCSLADTSVTLHSDSPCLPENNQWGELIGAYGASGCGPSTDVPDAEVPSVFALSPPSPNPFNRSTHLSFDLPEPCRGSLKVYNVTGRLVRTVADDRLLPAGRRTLSWDGRDELGREVASGVYLCRLEIGAEKLTERVLLLR